MAAAASSRKLVRQRREKAERMREMEIERTRSELQQVGEWFRKFDKDGSNTLDREELSQLLSHLVPDYAPDEAALNLLMEKAVDVQGKDEQVCTWDTHGITRAAVRLVVTKYLAYLKEQKYLDKIFEKFDTDKSGLLEKQELLGLMQTMAPAGKRPAAEDVEFVLCRCNVSQGGGIPRTEVLAAVATWRAIAQTQAGSSCCLVM
eukprot:COSAG01_NODE_15426_length_1338_cov_1.929782_2_plen_204_part_00